MICHINIVYTVNPPLDVQWRSGPGLIVRMEHSKGRRFAFQGPCIVPLAILLFILPLYPILKILVAHS